MLPGAAVMTTINVTEAEPQAWRTVLFNDVP